MNASGSVDALLQTNASSAVDAKPAQSSVSDSKSRENGFRSVFDDQQRGAAERTSSQERRPSAEQPNSTQSAAQSEDPQDDGVKSQTASAQASGEKTQESGKELPTDSEKVANEFAQAKAGVETELTDEAVVLPVQKDQKLTGEIPAVAASQSGTEQESLEAGESKSSDIEDLIEILAGVKLVSGSETTVEKASSDAVSQQTPGQNIGEEVVGLGPQLAEILRQLQAVTGGQSKPIAVDGEQPVAPTLVTGIDKALEKTAGKGPDGLAEVLQAAGNKDVKVDQPLGQQLKDILRNGDAAQVVKAALAGAHVEGGDNVQGDKSQSAVRLSAVAAAIQRAETSAISNTAPHTAANSPAALAVRTPVANQQWGQELGQRVMWLAGQKIQSAQIQLNPRELGPLEVRVQITNDQANVQFTSHQGAVREAVEAGVSRLRELFEAQGINLADVNVSDQSQERRSEESGERGRGNGLAGADSSDVESEEANGQQRIILGSGLVDDYA